MKQKTFFCLFEQSGTFKQVFKNLGFEAFDFDIQNEYGQTDFVCDLFDSQIVDNIVSEAVSKEATLLMFFPCTYFSDQQILWTRGENYSQRNWTNTQKIERSVYNIKQAARFYEVLCYWVQLCLEKNIPLVIENPYNQTHFLTRYFPFRASIIDKDRTRFGDKYKKPTQYFFINCKPNDNLYLLLDKPIAVGKIQGTRYGKKRSEIAPEYAENFIRTFIL